MFGGLSLLGAAMADKQSMTKDMEKAAAGDEEEDDDDDEEVDVLNFDSYPAAGTEDDQDTDGGKLDNNESLAHHTWVGDEQDGKTTPPSPFTCLPFPFHPY